MLRTLVLIFALLSMNGCLIVRVAPWRGEGKVKRKHLPKLKHHQGDRVWSFFPPDAIPAIDSPKFVPAADADFMKPNEMVVGVIRDGIAKAYSLWHLDRHEIVNDWLGETPVAVTW